MKTLLIRNGDLDFSGATYTLVRGAGKVKQDLAVALLEPLGADRFHPRWGSMMSSYIGANITKNNTFAIIAEVRRVVANYIATQDAQLARDRVDRRRSRFTADEVVTKLIDARANPTYDRIAVRIAIQTLAGSDVSMTQSVGAT